MNLEADLHVHTIYSDSTFSPREVISTAHEAGLSCIAITDHDSVGGVEEAIKYGHQLGIEVIPGVELTAEHNDTEIHILGYFVDYDNSWFQDRLKHLRESRRKRFFQMVEKLKKFNISLDAEKIIRQNPFASIGRLHLAQELYRKGYVSSIKDAFRLYIGEGKPCYVKKERLTPQEAITMIRKLGGVSVLAHPYLMGDDNIITLLVKEGIEGIEVYHSEHPLSAQIRYMSMAQNYNLLMTGGSDCHGLGKGKVLLGKVRISYNLVEKLKEYKNARDKS
jgi:hypothetical protein